MSSCCCEDEVCEVAAVAFGSGKDVKDVGEALASLARFAGVHDIRF